MAGALHVVRDRTRACRRPSLPLMLATWTVLFRLASAQSSPGGDVPSSSLPAPPAPSHEFMDLPAEDLPLSSTRGLHMVETASHRAPWTRIAQHFTTQVRAPRSKALTDRVASGADVLWPASLVTRLSSINVPLFNHKGSHHVACGPPGWMMAPSPCVRDKLASRMHTCY